jgi:succinyl-CoA synthetase alpha subunit
MRNYFRPIAALVAGEYAKSGYVMGHSGAWTGRGENDARRKSYLLSDAGAVTVGHPAEFGEVMRELLNDKPPTFLLAKERKLFNSQRRLPHDPATTRSPE